MVAPARLTGDAAAFLGLGALLDFQRLDELIQEKRNSVIYLIDSGFRRSPVDYLCPAPPDEFLPIGG
jgi:hypothetical protein